MPNHSDLIESLAADLAPVRVWRTRTGLVQVVLATLATAAALLLVMGLAPNIITGGLSSYFVLTNGLLLVLGACSATAVVRMASPSVGSRADSPKWALCMVAILPLTALLLLMGEPDMNAALGARQGWQCTAVGTGASMLVAAALILWLRRGAPVSLGRAGFYTGIAAGALGSVSYALSCPLDGLYHQGIWHVLPVIVSGALGRLAVPQLVRW